MFFWCVLICMLFSFSGRNLHKTVPSPETSIEPSLLMTILKTLGEMARTPCTKYARYSSVLLGWFGNLDSTSPAMWVLALSVMQTASGTRLRLLSIVAVGLSLVIHTGDLKPSQISLHWSVWCKDFTSFLTCQPGSSWTNYVTGDDCVPPLRL